MSVMPPLPVMSWSSTSTLNLAALDWRHLTALGVSRQEAKRIAKSLAVQQILPVYWRKLIELGVPMEDARKVAKAIAKYDIAKTSPDPLQRSLIQKYCPIVCRAELWRLKLLLETE